MTTYNYLKGRFKWARPQGMIFANQPWILDENENYYVPQGNEGTDFIIVSDHNRSPLNFSFERIEDRKRMLNGTMRSYHIADKLKVSVSWDMLPSRRSETQTIFDSNGRTFQYTNTVDGGADGVSLLDWYEDHSGPFWVLFSYDKDRDYLKRYQDIAHMYFSSFSYTVEKRGATNFDLWNINLDLEEV